MNQEVYVVTVSYNCCDLIEETILSVINQTYNNVKYIIIDGNSNDGTKEIIKKYESSLYKYVSEKDNGIYDAMNKALKLIDNKEAYIIFMNAGDYFCHRDVISDVIRENYDDFIYGKINIFDKYNKIEIGTEVNLENIVYRNICRHQSVFCKRYVFDKVGLFNYKLKIASDYEFFVKVFKNKSISKKYMNYLVADMNMEGVSSKRFKESLNEKLKVIKREFTKRNYLKAYFYIKLYEIPRNNIRIILTNKGLIKYWRKVSK